MKNKHIEKAISLIGSQQLLAKKCGRAQPTVCDWLHGKSKVPVECVLRIVSATGNKVKAHEIRPDLPDLFPHPDSGLYAPDTQHTDA
ncbi:MULTISPECIES: transcriptional regulator [Providencia]|uniref:transcriptional regulator n=1 Tax=Providencia TaxID=586 RepID=UPI001B358B57|nr:MULTISPECIES: helix-turn-helix domain-containing protein [Providencia]MBQ0210901.1 helix-turn-helix domain-containing protein [Providencia rettgeri]MBS0917631.1 helix-turn-helix domain-containing protein [Providencia rettgeri]HEM8141405.1 helix-turn-helix domain-containing protein [Providencia rettgeri]